MILIAKLRHGIGKAIVLSVIGLAFASFAARDGRTEPSPQDLASQDWWTHRAAESAAKIEDDAARGEANHLLAYALARIGELEPAANSANQVSNTQIAVYSLTFVARQYHELGDAAGAASLVRQAQQRAQAAQQLSDPFIYGHLIGEYLALDMNDDAIALAKSIPAPPIRASGLFQVAADAAQNGDLALARAIVDDGVPDQWKSLAWLAVASGSAGGGHVADVNSIATELPKAEDRDRVYATLASALVEQGQLDEANNAVSRIESSSVQAEARAKILQKRAETQTIAEIRTSLVGLRSRDEKLVLYNKLIERLTAEGNLEEAEDAITATIEAIQSEPREDVSSKFGRFGDDTAIATVKSHYLPIAVRLAQQGNLRGAKQRIRLAADAITALPESASLVKWMGLAKIVPTQILVGDLAGARAMLAQVPAGFGRSQPAGVLAAALAESGDIAAAIEVAEWITPGIGSGSNLGVTAAAVCRAGDIEGATKLLEGIQDPVERGRAYRAAGRRMIDAGSGKQLADWLDASPTDLAETFASLGAAEGLSQDGANDQH